MKKTLFVIISLLYFSPITGESNSLIYSKKSPFENLSPTEKVVYNNLSQKWPYVVRMLLGLLLIVCAFVLTGLIEKTFPIKKYFPFTGLALLVVVTWLLYKMENKNLNELGFNLKLKNVSLLFLGLLIGSVAFILAKYLRFLYTGETVDSNDSYDWHLIALGLYYILPMVAVEEFMFRGYLFKKTIETSSVIGLLIIFAKA
jgi:membrane protease YdiL (CAAX protease family)